MNYVLPSSKVKILSYYYISSIVCFKHIYALNCVNINSLYCFNRQFSIYYIFLALTDITKINDKSHGDNINEK